MSARSEATAQRYQEAKKLIDSGMSIRDAATKAGMGSASYYTYQRKELGKPAPPSKQPRGETKRKYTKHKPHQFIDLAPRIETSDGETVAIILCKPDQIKTILGRLK